jgi:uncharacterized protein YlxW (UPF0749 family)
MGIFHKDNCWCCNDYIAHVVHACKEQNIDLPLQAVGDTITTAWLMLMHDLESKARMQALKEYKELTDEAAGLRSVVKSCQATLTGKHGRIKRWDDKIRDLKDNYGTRYLIIP